MFERGQIVKPTADAVAASNFRETSRLRIRRSTQRRARHCSACYAAGLKAEGYSSEHLPTRPTQMRISKAAVFIVEPGDLYASASEQSSYLCLDHVESVDV